MKSQTPENEPLPGICENMFPFHRAVVICCLRPDCKQGSFGLDVISAEAKNLSPIIYLLSACSDSTPLVEEAAKKTKTELRSISIGQGFEEIA